MFIIHNKMIDDVVADLVKLFRWTAGYCNLQMINFAVVPAVSLLPGFNQITNMSHRAPWWLCDKISSTILERSGYVLAS